MQIFPDSIALFDHAATFKSSIFFELKLLFRVSKLDVTSLLYHLLSAEYFVGINRSIHLFYDVLTSVFQIFCKHCFD